MTNYFLFFVQGDLKEGNQGFQYAVNKFNINFLPFPLTVHKIYKNMSCCPFLPKMSFNKLLQTTLFLCGAPCSSFNLNVNTETLL